ncbi:cupin-like domain-containing protein [Pseudoxanthomonas indica]|uniref:Cupin-like domain-containing protein n=1 Tax=Pseudoxanthomonas indica TaxID=428993 RepID=A0A1T5JXY3_9GAMM|nr:cupin-like domain-containing protein [Pseudoxanthomonas indica]GGD45201.1 cupin [Pseudoxanthomonas indica]SKC56243.1 Cupin-like domain-containing protein [Pseudoxanthomonas indica]
MAISTEALPERHGLDYRALPDEVLHSDTPMVLRGVVADWPMVQAARQSAEAAIDYVAGFERADAPPVVATVGPPDIKGRFFYNEDLSAFNFRQEKVPLDVALKTLRKYLPDPAPPAIYLASTTIDTWLPGFRAANDVPMGEREALASIWIGNRTRIAAHQDVPDNLACVVAGRRRVTLFPPDQLRNLYIGPIEFTPAGQPISLVDFAAPDLERFPRFAEAQRHALGAELEPGDAVLIPSMWWHHMEGLEPFNVLVNYWWRQTPKWMDTPMNALMLALLTVRDLPPHQRETWREVFRHYVFEAGEETAGHMSESARRVLGQLDDDRARDLRARLLNRLNR